MELRSPSLREEDQHRSHYVSALTFGDVKAILPSLGVRTMLEVIAVLDTVERLDGSFMDIQLMSDGSTIFSVPYYKTERFQDEYLDDCYF